MSGIWQNILGGTFAPVSAIIVCIVAAVGVTWAVSRREGSDSTGAPDEQGDDQN